MGWSNEWNHKKPQIVDTQKPYSEILREHNAAAEAQMKAAAITETGQEILASVPPYVYIGMDQGDLEDTVRLIIGGKQANWFSQIDLNIPVGWNTYKAKAFQIGDLAVVISTDDPEEHCMVHVPTQTWFDNAMPEYKGDGEGYSTEALCLWAWKVQQTERIYFKELAKYNNSNFKEIDKSMLHNMQQYCLSIKVE